MNYVDNAIKNLDEICLYCKNYQTEQCVKSKCNIGFSRKVVNLIEPDKITVIDDGIQLIPTQDMKYYDERMVARGIAYMCKLCKQCMQNHNKNCTISLARRSLESTVLKEQILYPGNVLSYIINVADQNPNFANLIKEELKELD